MAALASTFFSSSPTLSRRSSFYPIPKLTLTKPLCRSDRNTRGASILVSGLTEKLVITSELSDGEASSSPPVKRLKKLFDSIFVVCASVALSASIFVVDVDSASAFAVSTPRKLQNDELATVRLFQENTPSVVYITNLAARYFTFLDRKPVFEMLMNDLEMKL